MATHLVWFRADLRIHDNLALAAACLSPWLLPRAGWAAPLCAVLALAALPADIRELRLRRRTGRVRRDPARR